MMFWKQSTHTLAIVFEALDVHVVRLHAAVKQGIVICQYGIMSVAELMHVFPPSVVLLLCCVKVILWIGEMCYVLLVHYISC